jgi:hypothetical protein
MYFCENENLGRLNLYFLDEAINILDYCFNTKCRSFVINDNGSLLYVSMEDFLLNILSCEIRKLNSDFSIGETVYKKMFFV